MSGPSTRTWLHAAIGIIHKQRCTLTPGLCWLAWYCRSPSYRTPVCGDGLPDYRDEEAFRRRVSDPDGFFYKEPINANGQVRRAEWRWW